MSKKCLKRPKKDVWRRGGRGEWISCCTPFSRQWGTHPQLVLTVRVPQSRVMNAEASRFLVTWRQLSQVWGFPKSTQNDHWDMSDPMSLPCASQFPPSSPNALRSTPSLSAAPRTKKHDGQRGGLVPSPLPVCPAHHGLCALLRTSGERVSPQSPAQALLPGKAPHRRAQARIPSLQPSGLPSPTPQDRGPAPHPYPWAGALEKEGIVLNRPRALENSERKPSNAAAGPSALRTEPVWQSQAPGEERGDPARGQRGKLQTLGVHASLSSGSLPHPPWSPTALQAQPPRREGNRTHPLFSLLTRTSDPAANFCSFPSSKKTENRPGSSQGLLTHHGTLCLEQPFHPSPGSSLSQIYQASTPLLTKTVASLTSYTSEA